ncbi:MAG TPA: DUF433 domain-containing protein [Fimbriiglobus sp.]|nr:DUF433 domain-containing protein [Fimbriiglobus sp.]
MPIVAIEHIEVDDRGVAKIVGTRSKVRHIVMDTMNGLSPEDIRVQYPHLSLAQIYAALAYYHDHKAEIDKEIEEGLRYADEMRAKNPNRFTRAELEARWRARFGTEPPTEPPTAGG